MTFDAEKLEPNRPARVPLGAIWNAADQEWCFGVVENGRKQGPFLAWRADGTLANLCYYTDAVPHGPFYRYHESGEIAQRGHFTRGEFDGRREMFRTAALTTERSMEGLGDTVWRAEIFYARGKTISARAFNANGTEVAADGECLPSRPAEVPASAHFSGSDNVWRDFQVLAFPDGSFSIDGMFRQWSAEGKILAEKTFARGQLHGPCRQYSAVTGDLEESGEYGGDAKTGTWCKWNEFGSLDRRTRYTEDGGSVCEEFYDDGRPLSLTERDANGRAHGRYEGWPDYNHFSVAAAVKMRGTQIDGIPCGQWQIVDALDKVLWTVDFGHGPLHAFETLHHQTLANDELSATHWGMVAFRYLGEGRVYEALVAAVRAAGQGDARTLTQMLSMHVLPTKPEAAAEMAAQIVGAMTLSLRFSPLQRALPGIVTAYLGCLFKGGDAKILLRDLAVKFDQELMHLTALDFANAVIALEPEAASPYFTRGLILMTLARMDEAMRDAELLKEKEADEGIFLSSYAAATAAPFHFWPALPAVETVLKEVDFTHFSRVTRTLEELQATARVSAARVQAYRLLLLAHGADPEAAWMPPDLASTFSLSDAFIEECSQQVDRLLSVPDLLAMARGEWYGMCLVCAVGGASGAELPQGPVAENAAHFVAVTDFWVRACESAEGANIPLFNGMELAGLPPDVVEYQVLKPLRIGNFICHWLTGAESTLPRHEVREAEAA